MAPLLLPGRTSGLIGLPTDSQKPILNENLDAYFVYHHAESAIGLGLDFGEKIRIPKQLWFLEKTMGTENKLIPFFSEVKRKGRKELRINYFLTIHCFTEI